LPRTLRQHVSEAMQIMSCLGVRTLMPQKGLPAPIRIDASDRQREYAVSVLAFLDQDHPLCCDRTGWMATYLRASDETASAVWHSIPAWSVCPLCLGRAPEERTGKGRVWCKPCGTFVRPKNYLGLVCADLKEMACRLRAGEISVKGEKGERE
jgi:hypothetical protein